MNEIEIAKMQDRISKAGFPLIVDGFWGNKSRAACESYLRSLMPKPNPWPETDQASLTAFYGKPGDESKLVSITFPYRMLYEGRIVKSTRVHRRCAESLLTILKRIGDRWQNVRGIFEEAEDYGGVYNNRPMRGGSLPSLHARGAAIDLDADDNGNKTAWPTGSDMPLEIIEEFSREGWTSAAAFWGRDAMHFQATRP